MSKKAIDSAIEIRSLTKSFMDDKVKTLVLDNISLDIGKNQIFGLLGPNGAGKTTLIYILSGILHADSGVVRVLGLDPKGDRQKLAAKINICSGNSRFMYNFTARELLKYYGLLYGLSGREISKKTDELIHDLGITPFQHKEFQALSTGMKQKIALAKSLVNEPEVLFLDEPTLGLDVEVAKEIRKYIRELVRNSKTTIILTSHYLFEVEELCDNVAVMNRGAIIYGGTTGNVKDVVGAGFTITATLAKAVRNVGFLKKIQGIKKIDVSGRELVICIENDSGSVEKVLSAFRRQKIAVMDFEVRKPTLEEAFLRLIKK